MADELTPDQLADLLPTVVSLGRMAGKAVMEVYLRGEIEAGMKQDESPITEADLASHSVIVEGLARIASFPVLSEESAQIPYEERRSWERYWLVDPLDGTKEFIKRTDEFTVNIALIENGYPILGVVFAPAIDRMYFAARGCGAHRVSGGENSRISVSSTVQERIRVVASRSHRGPELDAYLEKLGNHECVSMGSSLKFCLVAEGSADLYPRLGPTMEWDTAAAQAVVEEAGGKVEDLEGSRLRYNKEDLHNPWFHASREPWHSI